MTMQSAVLLEPVEALDHSELPSLPTVTAGRRPAVVVQSRRGRPAPALVDVLGIHEMETVVVAADDDSLPDPGGSPLAIVTGADRLDETRASGRLAREQEWIRRADEAGTTVLGIGHGARVLALAFAARSRRRSIRCAGGPWSTRSFLTWSRPDHG